MYRQVKRVPPSRFFALALAVALATGCVANAPQESAPAGAISPFPSPTSTGGRAQLLPGLRPVDLVVAFPQLAPLSNMVHLAHAGDGSGRLYVVLQEGRIVRFDPTSTVAEPTLFLDIRDRVSPGGEQGLLGLAFDPTTAPTVISTSTTPLKGKPSLHGTPSAKLMQDV